MYKSFKLSDHFFFNLQLKFFFSSLHLSAVQHMKLTKAAGNKWSKKKDTKHGCRLWCYVNSRFFYTFLEHIVLMISDKKPLSAVSHLDGKSQILITGLQLWIFKYNFPW